MKPNAQPPPGAPENWSPEQRKLWLRLNNAPANMLLLTFAEFVQMERAVRTGVALKAVIQRGAEALDVYWTNEPELENACASAVFDARRFERAAALAQKEIDAALTAMQSLANLTEGGCDEAEATMAVLPIIHDTANKLGVALKFLREQREARRERKKETTG